MGGQYKEEERQEFRVEFLMLLKMDDYYLNFHHHTNQNIYTIDTYSKKKKNKKGAGEEGKGSREEEGRER